MQSLIHNVFKAHILVQYGKIYIVFVLHDGFRIRIMFSLLNDVIKRNNNLDIVHRGKKKNNPIYNIKCRLPIWTVKKYVNFC